MSTASCFTFSFRTSDLEATPSSRLMMAATWAATNILAKSFAASWHFSQVVCPHAISSGRWRALLDYTMIWLSTQWTSAAYHGYFTRSQVAHWRGNCFPHYWSWKAQRSSAKSTHLPSRQQPRNPHQCRMTLPRIKAVWFLKRPLRQPRNARPLK